jgi:hypothetical protein
VKHESADPEWSIVVSPAGNIVANVNALSGVPPAVVMPRDANAALIAAAPALLEALRDCITSPNAPSRLRRGSAADVADAADRRLEAINATIRAAIAKATGA